MQGSPEVARELFAPIAPNYERWARVLSLGQDARWRHRMIEASRLAEGSLVLDVAAGTGSITRLLEARGCRVVPVDQSPEMVSKLRNASLSPVIATAESLPFPDESFDGVTFGYLLRYVDDLPGCLGELTRVLRSGGSMGMVEFGLPTGLWRRAWDLYAGGILPLAGVVIGAGWGEVGRFLHSSIIEFGAMWEPETLENVWRDSGMTEVVSQAMSLGGGLVMWGRKT
ncbi:MAG: methyltransferase domain-containing protein [Acidimicrobiia bacterium]|nr:methyltransferase domain-containing protein [Acidimicrobiia bacterium]